MGWESLIPLASSALGFLSQEETNDENRDLTISGRTFNSAEALANRDFQERMSNTSYQRAVKDMMASGLNPMLAYSQGGASTPSGSAGSAPAAIPMGNKGTAAAQAGQATATMQNTTADTAQKIQQSKLLEAQTEKTWIEKENLDTRDPEDPWGTRRIGSAQAIEERRATRARADQLIAEEKLTKEQAELVRKQIKNAIATNANIKADTRDTTANAVLRELAEAEAKNRQTHQLKYPGYNIDTKPFIHDAAESVNSAASAIRAVRKPSIINRR